MTPSTPTTNEVPSGPPSFTPEMISALFERSDIVSRREGVAAEREEFLKYQVAAIVRREEEIESREKELGFKKLLAMEKLQMALEQLEETEMMAAMNILHAFQIKILSKALLPVPDHTSTSTTGEIDTQAVGIDTEAPNDAADSVMTPKSNPIAEEVPSTVEIEQGENKPSPKGIISTAPANGAGGAHEQDPQNSEHCGSIVSPEETTPATTDIGSIQDSPVTVDNQSGAAEKKVKDAADKLKEYDVFYKPVNNPLPPYQNQSANIIDEAHRKGRERKSRLNNINWPAVNEGRTSRNDTTLPSNASFTFASAPIRTSNAANDAYSSPFHRDNRQSDCFRTFTPPNSRTADVPPPPKRTWPVNDVLKGPTGFTHPNARVKGLQFSTGFEPGSFWNSYTVPEPEPEPEPEPVFVEERFNNVFITPGFGFNGDASHPFGSEPTSMFD